MGGSLLAPYIQRIPLVSTTDEPVSTRAQYARAVRARRLTCSWLPPACRSVPLCAIQPASHPHPHPHPQHHRLSPTPRHLPCPARPPPLTRGLCATADGADRPVGTDVALTRPLAPAPSLGVGPGWRDSHLISTRTNLFLPAVLCPDHFIRDHSEPSNPITAQDARPRIGECLLRHRIHLYTRYNRPHTAREGDDAPKMATRPQTPASPKNVKINSPVQGTPVFGCGTASSTSRSCAHPPSQHTSQLT
jgi:hypothetical protein